MGTDTQLGTGLQFDSGLGLGIPWTCPEPSLFPSITTFRFGLVDDPVLVCLLVYYLDYILIEVIA